MSSEQPINWWSLAKERYATVDPRTLGLFRIYFGLLLLANLYDRIGGINFVSFYTNEGVLPNHYALFLPPAPGYWSLLLTLSSPTETAFGMAVVVAVYVLYLVGWQTRLMQVLALVCIESVNNRFILIQHGGNVIVNVLAVWTVFLPLGQRYSVDSVLRSLTSRPEATADEVNARGWARRLMGPHVGLAYFGVCFNFAAIYFFNALHKGGPSWRDGSAVHWTLWQNKLATGLAGVLRLHEPAFFSPALTWGTLVVEWALPLLILFPLWQRATRPAAALCIWGLHLGIASLMTLGPFSYGMMGCGVLLLQPGTIDWLGAKLGRLSRAAVVHLSVGDDRQLLFCRVVARADLFGRLTFAPAGAFGVTRGSRAFTGAAAVAAVADALPLGPLYSWPFKLPLLADLSMSALRAKAWALRGLERRSPPSPRLPAVSLFSDVLRAVLPAMVLCAVISQLLMESWGVPASLKPATRPQWMTAIVEYLTIPQGWSMFAPEPPHEETRLVVDATLVDGSHLDVLTGQPPDFSPEQHGPWGFDQHWCELQGRMPNWRHHWRNFRDYLMRRPRLEGRPPEQQVVSLEVWAVTVTAPPPGSTTPVQTGKKRLFGSAEAL